MNPGGEDEGDDGGHNGDDDGASHIATKESKSSLSSLSPCMLLSDGRELVGKLGPVDDGDDDYEKKDKDNDDNDDNSEEHRQ